MVIFLVQKVINNYVMIKICFTHNFTKGGKVNVRTLKEIREEQHITQKELSQKLGVAQSTVSHWEKGDFPLSKINKIAIGKVLNINWEEIQCVQKTK